MANIHHNYTATHVSNGARTCGLGKTEIPAGVIALGSAAVRVLAGLLAPAPAGSFNVNISVGRQVELKNSRLVWATKTRYEIAKSKFT